MLLAVREEPNESITMAEVGGDFRYFDARYDIVPLAPHRWRIVYEATMVPCTPMPPLVSLPIMRALISSQFGALVQEVSRRADRLWATGPKADVQLRRFLSKNAIVRDHASLAAASS